MKKVFCVLCAVAVIAVVSTSCSKTCTCKTYVDGKVTSTTEVDTKGANVKKCSDMNTLVNVPGAGKTGVECE